MPLRDFVFLVASDDYQVNQLLNNLRVTEKEADIHITHLLSCPVGVRIF
jgi:hypothetical protein